MRFFSCFFFFFSAHHTPLTTAATDKQCVTIHKWNECQCAEKRKKSSYTIHLLKCCEKCNDQTGATIYMQNGIIVFCITQHSHADVRTWHVLLLLMMAISMTIFNRMKSERERKSTSIEFICLFVFFLLHFIGF